MPRASQLFYTRRSRISRDSDPSDLGSDSGPPHRDRRNHRQRHLPSSNTRHGGLDANGCDPVGRVTLHSGQPPQQLSSHQPRERELIRLEHDGTQISSGAFTHSGNQNNSRERVRFSENDRLPGDVLLARERLLHRLSAVTFSSGRPRNQSSPSTHYTDLVSGDELRLVDTADRATEISGDFLTTIASVNYTIDQQFSKRSPGLNQDELNSMQIEVFSVPHDGDEDDDTSIASRECSICLESFLEGDELTCLPCGHKYHVCCLDPWVRSCGDCPYCRRGIVVNTDEASESS